MSRLVISLMGLMMLAGSGCSGVGKAVSPGTERASGIRPPATVVLARARNGEATDASAPTACRRVVSLSPGITETLYALNLGDRVVGVTRFCRYPPQARQKNPVGGYLDPNPEAVLRLRPDLVVIPETRRDLLRRFTAWGIPALVVDDRRMEGVLTSFREVGRICHRENRADAMIAEIEAGIARVRRRSNRFASRPSVLMVVGREPVGPIRRVYAVGEDGFYSRMIRLAGGRNALPASWKGFPRLSPEGILRLNPDMVIELAPAPDGETVPTERAMAGWRDMSGLSAVRRGRVYRLTADYVAIPGPRMLLTLERLAEVIHPDSGGGLVTSIGGAAR